MAHGHADALHYPIGRAMDEANFITERENARMILEAELVRQAVAGLLVKGARKQFSKLVKTLNVEAKPSTNYFGEAPVLTEAQKEGPRKKKSLADAVMPKGVPKITPDAP